MKLRNYLLGGVIPKKLLSNEEVIELAKRIELGDIEAKKKLTEKNLGLVQKMARRYLNKGLDYEELVQEGVLGLIKGIEHFDYRKGYAFSTYAIWWIRQAMQRATIDQGYTIRVPVHMREKLNLLLRIQNKYETEYDRAATDEELAEEIGVSVERIQEMHKYNIQPISLQTPTGEDDDGELEQFVEDVKQAVADNAIDKHMMSQLMADLEKVLTKREFEVICLRFGLFDGKYRTLEEVGVLFNLTRERIRQIEGKALRRLRGNRDFKAKFDENADYVRPCTVVKETEVPIIQFNIKDINSRLTPKILRNLVKLYPQRDIEMYAKYRGINLSTGYSNPIPKKEYSDNFLLRMNIIEQDLSEMVNYFFVLTEKRHIRENEAYEKVKKHMIRRSMRFKYPDSSQVELVEAVKKMSQKDRKLLVLRHGNNLLEYHEDKDNKQYQAYYLAYKRLENILNNKTETNENAKINMNEIAERFSGYTKERLIEEINLLPYEYREIIYIRFGKDLNVKNSFPKDKPYGYYYVLLKNALDYLEKSLNIERKFIPSIFNKDDLDYAIPLLENEDRKVIYMRHGEGLDQIFPWPKYSKRRKIDYYEKQYNSCILKIEEILKNRQDKRESSRFVLKFEGYTYTQIVATIPELDFAEQDILYVKHGRELDEYNPYPTIKSFRYYKNLYDSAVYNLKQKLMKKYRPEEYELKLQRALEFKNSKELEKKKRRKRTRNSNKNLTDLGSNEDILWAISQLSELQREVVYMRHGENLDELLDFPEPPKDKSSNYYYSIHYNAIKRLKKLIDNKDAIINKTHKTVRNKRNTILDIVKYEDLVKAVEFLNENQKNIMYLRHGENLDQVLPWPDAPEGKCSNYYYVTYANILKKINKIIENNFEVIERKVKPKKVKVKKVKTTIIDLVEHERLEMAVKQLSKNHRDVFYLRHGENLDQVLPWPDVPENKCSNYYYATYSVILKKINSILSILDEVKIEPENVLGYKEKIVEKEPNILKSKKKKEKKKTSINVQEQRDICLKEKSNLEKLKLNNFAADVYEKYNGLYGSIISSYKICNIINESIESYSVAEGISLEMSTQFKVETAILLEFANQYKENPDSDSSLEILMFLEEIIGDKIRKRYTNMAGNIPYCYISDDQISSSIEQTLVEYTGRLPFYVEVSARIKKLSR